MKLRLILFCQTCEQSELQGARDGTEAARAKVLTVGGTRERTAGNVSFEWINHRASKEGHCRVSAKSPRLSIFCTTRFKQESYATTPTMSSQRPLR